MIDPVKGEEGYNSFGHVYFTDQDMPHAKDVNLDGRCELFEA